MKTKVLLLGAVIAAFTATTFAAAPLLSPRAKSHAITQAATASDTAVVLVNVPATSSPRAVGNANKIVVGTDASVGSAATCSKMAGSPKMVAECASHPGAPMPCCVAMK